MVKDAILWMLQALRCIEMAIICDQRSFASMRHLLTRLFVIELISTKAISLPEDGEVGEVVEAPLRTPLVPRLAVIDDVNHHKHHRHLNQDTHDRRQRRAGVKTEQADRGSHGQFKEVGRTDQG